MISVLPPQVYGLPPNPVTYAEQLCSLFDACGPGKNIYFESQKYVPGSKSVPLSWLLCRAFIEFQHPTASRSCPVGKALPILGSVYLSLWMRGKRNRLSLFLNSDTQGSISPLPPPVVEDTDAIPFQIMGCVGICKSFLSSSPSPPFLSSPSYLPPPLLLLSFPFVPRPLSPSSPSFSLPSPSFSLPSPSFSLLPPPTNSPFPLPGYGCWALLGQV